MKKITFLSALIALTFSSLPAFAMDLMTAKDKGLIGETDMGLVDAVNTTPKTDLSGLVQTTNKGRMDVYKATAAEQGISVTEVQKIAAQKLFNMAAKGHYLKTNGVWTQK